MKLEHYNQIANSTAHRKSRDLLKDLAIKNSEFLNSLVLLALNCNNKNHIKACWILELVCEERLELFLPFLDDFANTLTHYKSDSAIRSISKICLFLTKCKKDKLLEWHEEKMIESGLDWLIQTNKAANAAYTMHFLYLLGKKHSWVIDELIVLLSRELNHQTPGYRTAAKNIMKRIYL